MLLCKPVKFVIFMLCLLLCLRVDLDRGEIEMMRQGEETRPILVLAYTDENSSLMEIWNSLESKLSGDRLVRIGWLNCGEERDLCNELGIDNCPQVLSWSRGQFKAHQVPDESAALALLSDLRSRVTQERNFEAKLKEIARPVFKFYFHENDNKGREVANQACVDAGLSLNQHFFFFTNNDIDGDPELNVLLDDNSTKVMRNPFTYESVRSFIADHRVLPFGRWKFGDILGMKRLFAVYVPGNGGIPLSQLKEWAKFHEDSIWFGSLELIGRRGCQAVFHVTPDMYPCVIVMNMQNLTFCVVDAVTIRKLDKFLERYRNGNVKMTPFDPMTYSDYMFSGLATYAKLAILIVISSLAFGYLTRPLWTRVEGLLKEISIPKVD